MKKLVFLFAISMLSVSVSAASLFSSNSGKQYPRFTSTDSVYVFIFNGLKPTSTISFEGNASVTDLKWYKYSDLTQAYNDNSRNLPFELEDQTGYVLEVNGRKHNIWVIDYQKHMPVLTAVTPDPASLNICKELDIKYQTSIPDLTYKTPAGNTYKLVRKFAVKYQTLEWTSSKWNTKEVIDSVTAPLSKSTVTAPLCDTKFTLSGDEIAHDLGIDTISKSSETYVAVATEAHITAIVTERTEKNEISRPQNSTPVSYSVPIDVEFLSNPNVHVTAGLSVPTYFNWTIYKDNQLIVTRTDQNQRYTFTEYGEYKVKVVVTNNTCSYSDSITVNAYEAQIKVPNVFTPNGDQANDEFRVAYKSLISFECWVYNRWGRKVYHWNDPQKGWNGKIGNADAAEGAYFYVIKASGYGLDPKTHNPKVLSTITLRGNINLLR